MDIRNRSNRGPEINPYLASKLISDLTLDELVFLHLDDASYSRTVGPQVCRSSLSFLVEMLSATFINVRTQQYGPIFASFSILDQVGGLYSLTSKETKYEAGIKRALDLFGGLCKKDLESLYSIRNGVFHDGSLVNIAKNGSHHVIFRMVRDSGKLLHHPENQWGGSYDDSMTEHMIKIDLQELKKLVHTVLDNCREAFYGGDLYPQVTDKREFFYRYLFATIPVKDEIFG